MIKEKSLIIWLCLCAILVYAIIILGGYTRLTHSGLSIVDWKPISGVFMPIGEESWQEEFYRYQQFPEYKQVNQGMCIQEFKKIFTVEFFHRLLGRLVGLVYLIPFLYFYLTKNKTFRKEMRYFAFIAALIGLQGGIGWFMVQSGLIDRPNVSQYRLAIHLMMACAIFMLLIWKIIPIGVAPSNKVEGIGSRKLFNYGIFSLGLLLLQITSGAFVAGLNAGLVYNSFPLMDGSLLPDGLFVMRPWYINILENVTLVQFIHRVLGIINFINLLAYSYKIFTLDNGKRLAALLAICITIQVTLGILTLVLQVPLVMALLHQAMAIILIIIMIVSLRMLSRE
jgi:heme a synthase